MEAKDTVMRVKCHCERLYFSCNCFCDDCNYAKATNQASEAQAEITWSIAEKAGMRKVVEWAGHDCDCGANLIGDRWHCIRCRQKQFKEWGIE